MLAEAIADDDGLAWWVWTGPDQAVSRSPAEPNKNCPNSCPRRDAMKLSDLEPFDDVPFYFWVKDEEGTYVWGNKAMAKFAGGDVAGKTDADLAPPNTAAMMRHHDVETLETGEPRYPHEAIEGAGNLSVCKWADELDGKPAAFGVSFQTED